MQKVAKFEKVSFDNFSAAYLMFKGPTNIEIIRKIYDDIILPKRATTGSAGYDFHMPDAVMLKQGETVLIPTGIRVQINDGWVLKLYPRSGLGFKFRLQLDNTVGIIDSDYYYSDNEGHIYFQIINLLPFDVVIKKGECFGQGILIPYSTTENDNGSDAIRSGGFGSTNE